MVPPAYKQIWPLLLAVATLTLPATARAEENSSAPPPPQTASRLEVSGAGGRLTIDSDHADVQSVLKAALKQAGKQYAPDATVAGSITVLLVNQPLDVALRLVCLQCFLKYDVSSDGIYRFTRDDDAVRRAFERIKTLNDAAVDQLRELGVLSLAAPRDTYAKPRALAGYGEAEFATGRNSPAALGGSAAGANGVVVPDAANGRNPAAARRVTTPSGRSAKIDAETEPRFDSPAPSGRTPGADRSHIYSMRVDPGSPAAQLLNQGAKSNSALDLPAYFAQSGFVSFNIPEEKPEPVAAVLQLFSRQSNVPIVVDPAIPNGLKFRLWGTLSPRQLSEALNVIAPTARLQWRRIGGIVYVFPAPEFQVIFGAANGPGGYNRTIYPPQRGQTQPSSGQESDRKGGNQ